MGKYIIGYLANRWLPRANPLLTRRVSEPVIEHDDLKRPGTALRRDESRRQQKGVPGPQRMDTEKAHGGLAH
jgi:hypothetical protein